MLRHLFPSRPSTAAVLAGLLVLGGPAESFATEPPDLVVTSVTAHISGQNQVTYTFEVTNRGKSSAYLGNVAYQAWLSREAKPSKKMLAAGAAYVARPDNLHLLPGWRTTMTFTAGTNPFRPHEYPYLVVEIDSLKGLRESNEKNNWGAARLR